MLTKGEPPADPEDPEGEATRGGRTPLMIDTEEWADILFPGEMVYFSITPDVTAVYTFRATATSYTDSYGYLYDSKWKQLLYDDDSGGNGNFKITYTLTAGKTYYYGARFYDSDVTGSFPVRLTYNDLGFDVWRLSASSFYVKGGATVTMKVGAQSSAGSLTYTWTDPDGKALSATGPTLKIKANKQGDYRCTVEDGAGNNTYLDFYLDINNNLSVSMTGSYYKLVNIGKTATLKVKVKATNKKGLKYQWYRDGNPIPGATKASYTIPKMTVSTPEYGYGCQVTDRYGNSKYVTYYVVPNFGLKIGVAGTGLKLSWKAVTGATEYVVERDGSDIAHITETVFTDTGVTPGVGYRYEVYARIDSSWISLGSVSGAVMAAPQNVQTSVYTYDIEIYWNSVEGADYYILYRKAGSGKWKKIGTTGSTGHDDYSVKAGTKYSYKVAAVCGDVTGPQSKAVSASIKKTKSYAPSFKLKKNADGASLTWKKVKGAARYCVVWEWYDEVNHEWLWGEDYTDTNSYKFTQAKSGYVYDIGVQSIDKNGNWLPGMNWKSMSFVATPNVTFDSYSGNIEWSPVAGVDGYRIQRKDGKKWVTKYETYDAKTLFYWYDDTAVPGKSYTYRIVSLNKQGKVISSWRTFTLAVPEIITCMQPGSGHDLMMEWKAVPGAAKYAIWYYNMNTRQWVQVDTTVTTSYGGPDYYDEYYYEDWDGYCGTIGVSCLSPAGPIVECDLWL
ncbi:MAG: hypothetical protein IKQ10_06155 [Oscillospiraceae bacterium]|nr:hypothetical protein [Oscillospiraceae bacterium]